jgi:flagellar protein FliO/FliZ
MRIINRFLTQKMLLGAGGPVIGICPATVLAAEKPLNLAPAGMAGEVLGGGFILQSLAGLLIVLVSVVALAWMMRRFGRLQLSAKGALRMIDGMALSTRERIVLVQVGDTQVLLGVAPGRVEAIHVLDKPVVADEGEEITGSFAVRLKEALGKERQQ